MTVSQTIYLYFEGLRDPIALEDAAPLLPMIGDVLSSWPYVISDTSDRTPFVIIRPSTKGKWLLSLTQAGADPRRWDAVNVICDLVAEMAWERLRSDRALLCLHAAAVAFEGRLVVFPNVRRSGKSTLTAALTRLGFPAFTDDFLPVRVDPKTATFQGIANGIAPRIRLPLPESFDAAFHVWVATDFGPANRQYKYLSNAPIAQGGATMPLGAMVVLDRQDAPVAPTLAPMAREDALGNLITQNFARTQQSGTILQTMDALSRDLPVFRLTYHCGQKAAAYLAEHPTLKSLPAAKSSQNITPVTKAPLDKLNQPAARFVPSCKYVQAHGLTETQVGDDHFLADGNGLSIYRLNPGSVAIWRVLSEPTDLDEVVEILSAAFEDVPPSQIATDSESLLRSLVAAHLVVPVTSQQVAS